MRAWEEKVVSTAPHTHTHTHTHTHARILAYVLIRSVGTIDTSYRQVH